ncbi:radical SAM protein [Paraburkholderia sediminicola]|uniref:radical SAM protein n=1 Tax=Paraburkholderia sediminicola TaxID=458836 RepID=UPI0038BB87A3
MRPILSLDFPIFVKWYITSRCNLRCSHCYLEDYTQTAEKSMVMPIIDYLGKNGVQGVVLIGGEPLTRPDLEEIVQGLTVNGISVKIATNGLLATPERCASLVNSGARKFQVSVEGASAADNDPIRGHGTFEQIIRGAGNLQDAGGHVSLAVTVTRQNHHRIPDVFQMMKKAGLTRVKFNAFIPIGTGALLNKHHALTPEICREVTDVISSEIAKSPDIDVEAGAFYQRVTLSRLEKKEGPTLGCGAGTSSLIINSDFTLSACDMLVENDRTSEPITTPQDIGKFWTGNRLFKKWRGKADTDDAAEFASFSQVHQHGCHVAYNTYGKNIFTDER